MKRKLIAIALLVAMLASMLSVGMVAMAEGIELHDDEDHIANIGGWVCIETVTERGDTPECGEHVCGESEPCEPSSCLNPNHKDSDDCDAPEDDCVFTCILDTGHTEHTEECYEVISSAWTCTPPVVTFECSFVHIYPHVTDYDAGNLTEAEIADPSGYAKPLAHEGKYYSLAETSVDENDVDGYTITMTYAQEMVTVNLLKVWMDNLNIAKLRPTAITVWAYAENDLSTVIGTAELLPPVDNTGLTGTALEVFLYKWTGTITLPLFDSNGITIDSYVFVDDAGDGYNCIQGDVSTIVDDEYKIVNELDETTTFVECVVGKKVWNDNKNAAGNRPQKIFVYIVNQDGRQVGDKIPVDGGMTADEWEFTLFFPARVKGVLQVYTLREDTVPGYAFTTTGSFSLDASGQNHDFTTAAIVIGTNTPREDPPPPETVNLRVIKQWDNSVPANMLPDSITVQLVADGQPVSGQTRTLTPDSWENSFNGLLKYNGSTLIEYSVVELNPGSFTPRYGTVTKNGSFYEVIVTNSYNDPPPPEYVSLRVFKEWDIVNAPDTIVIPQSIAVQLYADGQPVPGQIITITMDNWQGSFTGLPKYNGNTLIEYSVVELDPGVFTPENSGITVNGNTYEIVITNIYIGDEDVPLGPPPTPDTGGDTEIDDGEVPLTDAPRTADDINPLTAWILLATSLFGIGIVMVSTKKKVRK